MFASECPNQSLASWPILHRSTHDLLIWDTPSEGLTTEKIHTARVRFKILAAEK
jgi:hypothetical protein